MHTHTSPATVLITGATSGIGKALAQHFASNSYQGRSVRLVLVGRRPLSILDATFYRAENYCQADLAHPEGVQSILTWLEAQEIEQIDCLIQNAGMGYVGSLDSQSNESIIELLRVNLDAPLALTHHLMARLDKGKVVFISSVATAVPGPDYAVYTATKRGLDGFARNLRTELAAPASRYGTTVQLIRPGATRTEMHQKSGADLKKLNWETFPSAESVAAQIIKSIEGDHATSVIGTTNKVLAWVGHHLDGLVDGAMRQARKRQKIAVKTALRASGSPNPPTAPKQCVITGAADGIGKALARVYLAKGYQVTGIDFDQERAAQTQAELDPAGVKLAFLFGDLSDLGDLERLENELASRPVIDLFIHNAGISAAGHFTEMDWSRQQKVLDVNLRAPLLLTAGLLRRSLLKSGGGLVFISSLSYYAGYPGAAVYGASKDGLASFARSLSVALAPQQINVLTVFPGPTRTAHARRYSPDNSREEKRMSPEELAQRIGDAEERRKKKLVPGSTNQVSAVVGKAFPRLMDYVMRKVILDKL